MDLREINTNDCPNCWYKSPKNPSANQRFPCEICLNCHLWVAVWEDEELEKKVDELYQKMFLKGYSGNQMNDWDEISFFGGGNNWKYKDKIREFLLAGKKVKTGYRSSSKIRNVHDHIIFSKDAKTRSNSGSIIRTSN